jgi:hypothetical protein
VSVFNDVNAHEIGWKPAAEIIGKQEWLLLRSTDFRMTRGRMFFKYKKIQNLVPSVVNKKNIKMVLLDMKNQSTAHIIQH